MGKLTGKLLLIRLCHCRDKTSPMKSQQNQQKNGDAIQQAKESFVNLHTLALSGFVLFKYKCIEKVVTT